MNALRPLCPAGGHRVPIWHQTSNIDREINKCWLRVMRFQKYKIYTEIFGIIDCRRIVPPELERTPHTLCYIFSWFRILLAFQSYIWSYDWLRTYPYRMIECFENHPADTPATDTWLLTSHFYIRNNSKWGHSTETPLNEVIRWHIIYLNRRTAYMYATDGLTDSPFDWNFGIIKFENDIIIRRKSKHILFKFQHEL